MPRTPINYQNTIIYVIKCKDDNITEEYIGSTTNFNERKCQHKTTCNNEKDKSYNELKYQVIRNNGGWTNWIMLEVLKYPCNDKNEARMKEEEIRVERNAKLNSYKAFGAETKAEYLKQYQEEHKTEISEYQKQWYQEHKDEIKQKDKQRYNANKEILKEQKKQYWNENKDEINKRRKELRTLKKQQMEGTN